MRVISLSLGATRSFSIKVNSPNEGELDVPDIKLSDGDICSMEGFFQKQYRHAVYKQSGKGGHRINLTWRWVVKHNAECEHA